MVINRQLLKTLVVFITTLLSVSIPAFGASLNCNKLLSNSPNSSELIEIHIEPNGMWSEQFGRFRFMKEMKATLPSGSEFQIHRTKPQASNCHFYSLSQFFLFENELWLNSSPGPMSDYNDGFRLIISEYFTETATVKVVEDLRLPKNLNEKDLVILRSPNGLFIHSGILTKGGTGLEVISKLGYGSVETMSLADLLKIERYSYSSEVIFFRYNEYTR